MLYETYTLPEDHNYYHTSAAFNFKCWYIVTKYIVQCAGHGVMLDICTCSYIVVKHQTYLSYYNQLQRLVVLLGIMDKEATHY